MSILSKLKDMAEKLTQGREAFDPTSLNDPFAEQVEWGPAKGGGTNIGTHALHMVSANRVEFKVKKLALLFPGIFMVVGLGVMIGMTIGGINSGEYKMIAIGRSLLTMAIL